MKLLILVVFLSFLFVVINSQTTTTCTVGTNCSTCCFNNQCMENIKCQLKPKSDFANLYIVIGIIVFFVLGIKIFFFIVDTILRHDIPLLSMSVCEFFAYYICCCCGNRKPIEETNFDKLAIIA